jgi:hypothetical protein
MRGVGVGERGWAGAGGGVAERVVSGEAGGAGAGPVEWRRRGRHMRCGDARATKDQSACQDRGAAPAARGRRTAKGPHLCLFRGVRADEAQQAVLSCGARISGGLARQGGGAGVAAACGAGPAVFVAGRRRCWGTEEQGGTEGGRVTGVQSGQAHVVRHVVDGTLVKPHTKPSGRPRVYVKRMKQPLHACRRGFSRLRAPTVRTPDCRCSWDAGIDAGFHPLQWEIQGPLFGDERCSTRVAMRYCLRVAWRVSLPTLRWCTVFGAIRGTPAPAWAISNPSHNARPQDQP